MGPWQDEGARERGASRPAYIMCVRERERPREPRELRERWWHAIRMESENMSGSHGRDRGVVVACAERAALCDELLRGMVRDVGN